MASKTDMAAAVRSKRYRSKLRKERKCLMCRRKTKGLCLCPKCTKIRRLYQRGRQGSEPWVKGKRGRPPKYK